MTRRRTQIGPVGRRGSAYVLILAVSTLVLIIGLAGLAAARTGRRTEKLERDWQEAGLLAQSAIDRVVQKTATDIWWRETFADQEADFGPEIPLGDGFISLRVDDLVDTDLDDENADPLRLHGRGRIDQSIRVYSVVAFPTGEPLDVLRTAIHASGELDVNGLLDLRNGPASTNALLDVSGGQVLGDAEAATIDTPSQVIGTVTAPAPAKSMPAAALFALYKNFATNISFNDIVNLGGFDGVLLSPARNPFKLDRTNPDGLYFIKPPRGVTLTIRRSRIEGTLLVELDESGLSIGPEIVWSRHRPDYPALIVYTKKDLGTKVDIDSSGELSEFLQGVNFNPPDTGYYGDSDSDQADVYPASIRGLIHVIRDVGPPPASRTTISAPRKISGCVIADGRVRTEPGTIIAADPTLLSFPPLGYTTSPSPDNLLTNGDMEQSLTGWSPVGASTTLAWEPGGHTSQRIAIKHRSAAVHGIRQDVTAKLDPGTVYTSDLWLKMRDDAEAARVSLVIDSTGEGVQWLTTTVPDVQKSWTRVLAQHSPTWTGTLTSAYWFVTTTSTDQDFYIDDAFLTPHTGTPPPQLRLIPGTWRSEPAP